MEPSEAVLAEAYANALRAIPGAKAEVRPHADPRGLDAVVTASLSGHTFTLLLEVKRTVFPRDVYQMLHQLDYVKNTIHQPFHEVEGTVLPVLVAESISQGAQDILKRENVAFFDSGGSMFLSHDGTYIDFIRPPPAAQTRLVRNLYSGARARVLTALLLEREHWFSVTEVVDKAQVSLGTASETLKAMEDLEWVRVEGSGPNKTRRVLNPGEILDSWGNHAKGAAKYRRVRRYYVPYLGSEDLARHLDHHLVRNDIMYAFTGEYAAQHYTPYLTQVSQIRARLVWDANAEHAMRELDARAVAEGANFAVLEVPSPADLLYREHHDPDSYWFANPIQIYLDLLGTEGRAKDMAKFFREQLILF
jgi:hypothetical protein